MGNEQAFNIIKQLMDVAGEQTETNEEYIFVCCGPAIATMKSMLEEDGGNEISVNMLGAKLTLTLDE